MQKAEQAWLGTWLSLDMSGAAKGRWGKASWDCKAVTGAVSSLWKQSHGTWKQNRAGVVTITRLNQQSSHTRQITRSVVKPVSKIWVRVCHSRGMWPGAGMLQPDSGWDWGSEPQLERQLLSEVKRGPSEVVLTHLHKQLFLHSSLDRQLAISAGS